MRTYRASSLGYSLEALVAGHLGYAPVAPPEWMQEKFDEGHRLEPIVINYLRSLGWEIDTAQATVNANGDYQIEVQLEVIPGVAEVVGHVDGIGRCSQHLIPQSVVEIKTMAHKSFLDWAQNGWDSKNPLIEKYKWQQSAYVLATGLPHAMVGWDKDGGEDDPRIMTHLSVGPFYSISDIANKLAQAEECIAAGIVPEGCKDFPCPYFYLHAPNESEVESADDELEALLESWLTWDRAEKAAKKEKDAHRERILALTGDATAAKVKGECGVTVETYWQDEKEYTVRQQGKWVTRVQGPRGKNGS